MRNIILNDNESDIADILVTYSDGTTKHITTGGIIDFDPPVDQVNVEFLNCRRKDFFRLIVGFNEIGQKIKETNPIGDISNEE